MFHAPFPDRLAQALADRYTLERELGAGGMATVYLAQDLKHDRRVAIKVLRPELAAVIGGERFLTEIKTTAALQHPHILPLFDSGAADGFLFYVMPFVDGESLRDKLDREGQLGVPEAVAIAKAVASALHYAHERGIVHRDIKPANILIHAGQPVVADFGIALAISAAGGGRLTETGMSVGTPHYMSPEQATADREVTGRSDIYSLSCVLYEMLAGEPPHTGANAQAVIMRILTEPARPVTDHRKSVPPNVRCVLGKALEKLPADRFGTAEEFARELDNPAYRYGDPSLSGTKAAAQGWDSGTGWGRWKLVALTSVVAFAIGAGMGRGWGGAPQPGASFHIEAAPRVSLGSTGVTVGPAGELVYRPANLNPDGSAALLHLKTAMSGTARALPGTEQLIDGAYSPDGRWLALRRIVFEGRGQPVVKYPLEGGDPVPVWEGTAERPWSLFPWSWSDDGWIYGVVSGREEDGTFGGIGRIPESGGSIEVVFRSEARLEATSPTVLPGGGTVLFDYSPGPNAESRSLADARILALDVSTGDTTFVTSGWGPQWAASGHMVFARGGVLFAAEFDESSSTLVDVPFPLGIELDSPTRWPRMFHLGASGTLAYVDGFVPLAEHGSVTWWSRNRPADPVPLRPLSGSWLTAVSPNGRTVAYRSGPGIVVQDVVTGTTAELEDSGLTGPVWSPDGETLLVAQADSLLLHFHDVSGGRVRSLPLDSGWVRPTDWPVEERVLAEWLPGNGAGLNEDLVLVDPETGAIEPLLGGDWAERAGKVSPDGSWLAYLSDETGRLQVYVRSFPDMGPALRVSSDGVSNGFIAGPVWDPTGHALYYIEGGALMRVELDLLAPQLGTGARSIELAPAGIGHRILGTHPDGRLLLWQAEAGEADGPRVMMVTDLASELRRNRGN